MHPGSCVKPTRLGHRCSSRTDGQPLSLTRARPGLQLMRGRQVAPRASIRRCMRPRPGTLLVVLLLAAGCADALSLMTLRRSLTREFHEEDIGVSLTDGLVLTVTFVHGAAGDAPCDSLAAFALRVAASVRRNYQGFDSLQTVSVALEQRGSDDSVRTAPSRLPFRFSRSALQTGLVSADSASAIALCELDAGPPDRSLTP